MAKFIGQETKKALKNFRINSNHVRYDLIKAIIQIKLAASIANFKSSKLTQEQVEAIKKACLEILTNFDKYKKEFTLPCIQGGAGTSINMNVNEVIANLACKLTGETIHYLDHVNASQSTNDVNPSALKIVSLRQTFLLKEKLRELIYAFNYQASKNKQIKKLARTHLQDAIETSWFAVFKSYAEILERNLKKINQIEQFLYELNLSGTAIGTGLGTTPKFKKEVYTELKKITGLKIKPAKNLMSLTSSSSDFLSLSNTLTVLFTDLSKIATDFRVLASGPNGGIAELKLKELQKGSTIMPGKVNPIIPESINQIYFKLSGNNLTIEHACHAAILELSVMFPVIAESLLDSLQLAINGIDLFTECVKSLKVNKKNSEKHLKNSSSALMSKIGISSYEKIEEAIRKN